MNNSQRYLSSVPETVKLKSGVTSSVDVWFGGEFKVIENVGGVASIVISQISL